MAVKKIVETNLPTEWGPFVIQAYASDAEDAMPHLALIHKDFDGTSPAVLRIHSECLTGDLMGSRRCDCGDQFRRSMDIIAQEKGVMLYLRQEGRGIGLINKLKAYNIQDQGFNTAEANTHLGFEVDERQYDAAISMLADLGISDIKLITNNPDKIKAFDHSSIRVVERIPILITPNNDNLAYMQVKKELMGHLLK